MRPRALAGLSGIVGTCDFSSVYCMSRALLKSTSVVGVTTLISRITGLVRDMALSQVFGAGLLMASRRRRA